MLVRHLKCWEIRLLRVGNLNRFHGCGGKRGFERKAFPRALTQSYRIRPDCQSNWDADPIEVRNIRKPGDAELREVRANTVERLGRRNASLSAPPKPFRTRILLASILNGKIVV